MKDENIVFTVNSELIVTSGFEFVKQNRFAKNSCCRQKNFWICEFLYEKWEEI